MIPLWITFDSNPTLAWLLFGLLMVVCALIYAGAMIHCIRSMK